MKLSRFAFLLAALNVALLGVVIWQRQLLKERDAEIRIVPPSPVAAPSGSAAPFPATKLERRNSGSMESDGVSPTQAAAIAAVPKPALNWQRLESADYRTYMTNLRAVGCPEQTVRDIVSADVLQAFAPRRVEALSNRYQNFQYWKVDPTDAARRSELVRQREALDNEMGGALRELLGTDATVPDSGGEWRRAELEQQLSFLPEDKRAQALATLLRNFENDQELRTLTKRMYISEDAAERQHVLEKYAEKRAALSGMLSPVEYARVEMTTSWTAENVRRGSAHFAPTEQEFRAIFQAWQPHDENLARLFVAGEADPGNDHVFEQIRTQLGDERFAVYRRTWWK